MDEGREFGFMISKGKYSDFRSILGLRSVGWLCCGDFLKRWLLLEVGAWWRGDGSFFKGWTWFW